MFDPAIAQEIINALESANVEIVDRYSPEYINDFKTNFRLKNLSNLTIDFLVSNFDLIKFHFIYI